MTKRWSLSLVTILGLMVLGMAVDLRGQAGETPDIIETGPGHITWANVDTSMYYTVEWRNALTTGDWHSVYEHFRDVQSQDGTITREIPTFFRVRAYPVPEFIRYLTATSHLVKAGYYAEDVDLTAVDPNLASGNIRDGVILFGVPGTVLQATGDATAAEVLTGRSFSRADATDVAGTMPNREAQNVTPGTTAQAILQGYHSGAGEVAGDADLTASNIKAGINIFGVAGNLVESTGDATAAQVLTGATFSKAGEAGLTGTMANQADRGFMPGTANVPIPAGYYSGAGVVTGDAALVTGNIRAGATVFEVPGTVLQATGDATAAEVLTGRSFSRADATDVAGTMPNREAQNVTPGTTAQAILQGYHDGAGEVAGDADLTASNIKAGINIFGVAGNLVESTGDATAAQVLTGATFSKAGEAGLTGTMANQADRGFMPGTANVPIPAGYYSGVGVVTGDAALVTGNIRAGATIFGVAGDPNVVDTVAGDATAADLLADRVAYVGGSAVTGTIATRTLSPDSAEVAEGFYAATNLTLVATDLVAENIREGISLFGVTGTHEGAGSLSGMALIPAGDFVKTDHPDGAYLVTNYISAFYIDRTHVTKALWDEVRDWGVTNGYTDLPVGSSKATDHPVHTLNWFAAVKWCNARSEMEGRSPVYFTDADQTTVYRTDDLDLTNACVAWASPGYRLPTASEWEKAARGGLHAHRFPWGHTTNRISHAQANFQNNGEEAYQYGTTGYHPDYDDGFEHTSPVGSFAPNGYGLYDMAGNVFDWCWDKSTSAAGYYVAGSDPKGPDSGSPRSLRGGSWTRDADHCRIAKRYGSMPSLSFTDTGFRTVLSAQ